MKDEIEKTIAQAAHCAGTNDVLGSLFACAHTQTQPHTDIQFATTTTQNHTDKLHVKN